MASLSKLASLMGIPPELRLRVYAYLLTPYLTDEEVQKLRVVSSADYHDCNDTYDYQIICDCANKNLHPQVLLVNKLIFTEAVAVLYQNMGLKISVYHDNSVDRLPAYALPQIGRMLIVDSFARYACGKDAVAKHEASLRSIRTFICEKLPKLNHLRLAYGRTDGIESVANKTARS